MNKYSPRLLEVSAMGMCVSVHAGECVCMFTTLLLVRVVKLC